MKLLVTGATGFVGTALRARLAASRQEAVALAAALGKLIDDADLRRRMGAQSRLRAESEFGLETVIAQTLAVYREACA